MKTITIAKLTTMATSKLFDPKLFLEEYVKRQEVKPFEALFKPAIDLGSADFRAHEERLMAMMQANYGVPASMIYGGARSGGKSGRAMELAAQLQAREIRMADAGRIKGKSADWMVIDEAIPDVHPNCRCETVPVAASSLNVTTAHDDMLDALAMTFGLSRKEGEDDSLFRSRVRAMMGHQTDLGAVVAEFEGVLNVEVRDQNNGRITLTVTLTPSADRPTHRAEIAIAVEKARPIGTHVDVEFEVAIDPEEEENAFIRRLKSKILERYSGEE